MGKQCEDLIRAIGVYDFIIGTVISMALYPFFQGGGGLFFIGMACSFINLIINSYANSLQVNMKNQVGFLIVPLSYVLRIGLVCGLSILIFIKSEINFFIFISGYTAQFISIVIYGIKLKVKEGV